jgi:hypothetical protein
MKNMELSVKNKFRILCSIGTFFFILASYNIIFADSFIENELHLSTIGISEIPELVMYDKTTVDQTNEIVNFSRTVFQTTDIFAVGNNIEYTTVIVVYDVNQIDKINVFNLKSSDALSLAIINQDVENLEKLTSKIGSRVITLTQNSTNSFSGSNNFKPTTEGDHSIVALVYTKDNGKYALTLSDIPIYSVKEKVEMELIRVNLAQAKLQVKTNHVFEGLSWILVGWISFELAIQIRKK